MTGFVLNMTGLVLNMTEIVLNMGHITGTKIDFLEMVILAA